MIKKHIDFFQFKQPVQINSDVFTSIESMVNFNDEEKMNGEFLPIYSSGLRRSRK